MMIKMLVHLIFVLKIYVSVKSLNEKNYFWEQFVFFKELLTRPWFIAIAL